jgi:hypothetical protein
MVDFMRAMIALAALFGAAMAGADHFIGKPGLHGNSGWYVLQGTESWPKELIRGR